MPVEPATECYETVTFDTLSCLWIIDGEMPSEPAVLCNEEAIYSSATCSWNVVQVSEFCEDDHVCTVDGYVYLDVDQNQEFDAGVDTPQENIDVMLNGMITQTDEDGYYVFEDLNCEEEYVVEYDETQATGTADSAQDEGGEDQDTTGPVTESDVPSDEFDPENGDTESLDNNF
jgi:hypothetical protein